MDKNIILIGFMGVGKGRAARALAARTGLYTIDTDNLIVALAKKKIRTIFAEDGEPYFRGLEQRTADWLRYYVRNTIVSTGGGFFMVDNLGASGRIVYLHSSLDGIMSALYNHPKASKKIRKRPLLQDADKARALYDERLPLYRGVADYEINVEGLDGDGMAAQLVETLRLRGDVQAPPALPS
ncbi:MAG: shikimate kinase [Proteobacteria bacterium]|nr:shikimate kinase [Pseudomonadota bacterium]